MSGPAHVVVTLACAIDGTARESDGLVTFTDNGVVLGAVPLRRGDRAVLATSSASAAGGHSFACTFVSHATPRGPISSPSVLAAYDATGQTHDARTLSATVPAGAITITTQHSPVRLLDLQAVGPRAGSRSPVAGPRPNRHHGHPHR